MAKIIELPKLSPTMEEGTLVRWARQVGDVIEIDDLLAEVETDKATMEFRSFDRGTLLEKLVAEGAVARLGQPVAIFGSPGEDVTGLSAQTRAQGSKTATVSTSTADHAIDSTPPLSASVSTPAPAALETAGDHPGALPSVHGQPGVAGAILSPTTPRVRRLARDRGISLGVVQGSGDHGRVREQDLSLRTPQSPTVEASSLLSPGDTVRQASSMRRTIARRLTEAKQSVPHFYLEADLDVAALLELRQSVNSGRAPTEKISVNDFFVRACALALKAVPEANSSWVDGQVITYARVDISVAVAIEDGLLTPVVRGADKLSVSTISATMRDLAARARARKLQPEEFTRGTFSLSNLGMFQVDRFSAVINPPEGMILAVGAARDVPVVKSGAVVPGKRCAVTLSCDHRVVDGALGARWLQHLRALIENPMSVLV